MTLFRFSRLKYSFSSFTIFSLLFLCTFFLDCSLLSFGTCENLKLTVYSLFLPRFEIYRFLTFFFVNAHFVSFICDLFGYITFEFIIEMRWNLVERVKFLIITTWAPAVVCLIYYFIKFANTKTEADINFTGVCGSSSFVAAVMVVTKQLSIDTGSWKSQILTRYCPLIYMCAVGFFQLANFVPSITFAYSFFGLFFGWIYLRFIQKHTDGKRGDFRSNFSFVHFFPQYLQRFLSLPFNCLYALVVSIKLCPPIGQQHEILSAISFSKDVPSVSHDEGDRHKRIGLQELNARLAQKHESTQDWPDLFENEGADKPKEDSKDRAEQPTDPGANA